MFIFYNREKEVYVKKQERRIRKRHLKQTWLVILRSMILFLSIILIAKGCWESVFLANLTLPKFPSPRVLPNSYFPSLTPSFCKFILFCFLPRFNITIFVSLTTLLSKMKKSIRSKFKLLFYVMMTMNPVIMRFFFLSFFFNVWQ